MTTSARTHYPASRIALARRERTSAAERERERRCSSGDVLGSGSPLERASTASARNSGGYGGLVFDTSTPSCGLWPQASKRQRNRVNPNRGPPWRPRPAQTNARLVRGSRMRWLLAVAAVATAAVSAGGSADVAAGSRALSAGSCANELDCGSSSTAVTTWLCAVHRLSASGTTRRASRCVCAYRYAARG